MRSHDAWHNNFNIHLAICARARAREAGIGDRSQRGRTRELEHWRQRGCALHVLVQLQLAVDSQHVQHRRVRMRCKRYCAFALLQRQLDVLFRSFALACLCGSVWPCRIGAALCCHNCCQVRRTNRVFQLICDEQDRHALGVREGAHEAEQRAVEWPFLHVMQRQDERRLHGLERDVVDRPLRAGNQQVIA